ncbi:MAG: hypothetical protein JWN15_2524, partial [Firmicutes bacterium]|nr:hypothetical protein [Bacillota bacterium]
MLVLMDNGGPARPEEYLIGGSRNAAARHWVWEQVVPYVEERWPSAGGSQVGRMGPHWPRSWHSAARTCSPERRSTRHGMGRGWM